MSNINSIMFGSIAAAHRQSIKELRVALKDNAEFQQLADADLASDYHLLRFVIARNSKTEDSKKMIEDHLAWRKEHNVGEIRKQILGKRIEAATFPHSDYFKPTKTGSWNSVSDGGRSRSGNVVFIECMGMDGGALDDKNKEEMHKLAEHMIGFFESRNIQLETLSTKEDKFIRTMEIRDLSAMSFIPKVGTFTAVKAFMNLGLLNYPEIGVFVLFVNPPTVFATLFAMIKPFIPGGVERS